MKESLTIRLDEKLLDFLRNAATEDFRNVNNYIEMVLLKHMQEQQAIKKPGERPGFFIALNESPRRKRTGYLGGQFIFYFAASGGEFIP